MASQASRSGFFTIGLLADRGGGVGAEGLCGGVGLRRGLRRGLALGSELDGGGIGAYLDVGAAGYVGLVSSAVDIAVYGGSLDWLLYWL